MILAAVTGLRQNVRVSNRRARPTLRVLRDDLASGWTSPRPRRLLDEGAFEQLHPLSELPHPVILKACESCGPDPDDDNFVGPIACCTSLRLLEIKAVQWRGGVWTDPATGVRWLVVAGLAKGGHADRDDFYKRLERADSAGTTSLWLPTTDDVRLLRQETAARIKYEWELGVQRLVRDAMVDVNAGGSRLLEIEHPVPGRGLMARLELAVTPVREDGYEADEVVVELLPEQAYSGSALIWQLTLRTLISISPPEQGWDRYKDTYSNICEPGALNMRVARLDELIGQGALGISEPGVVSHFSHRKYLMDSTVHGTAVRALCGAFFVPTQDHAALQQCPTCRERWAELPDAPDA